MIVITFLLLIALYLVDIFRPVWMPRFIVYIRYWAVLAISIFTINAVLLARHPTLASYMIGLIAVLPLLTLLIGLLGRKYAPPVIMVPLLIIGFIAGLLAAEADLLDLPNDSSPNASSLIPAIWWFAVVLYFIYPDRYYRFDIIPVGWARLARNLSLASVPIVILLWMGFTQFIVLQARASSANENWCIRETDGARLQTTLWISPRKMLLENAYGGITLPYLLFSPDGKAWSSHWSFWAMGFVENETDAFGDSMSFYKTLQTNPPC